MWRLGYLKGRCFPSNLLASKAVLFRLFSLFSSTLTSFFSYFFSIPFSFFTSFLSTPYLISSPFSSFISYLVDSYFFALSHFFLSPLLDLFCHFLPVTNFGILNKQIINLCINISHPLFVMLVTSSTLRPI